MPRTPRHLTLLGASLLAAIPFTASAQDLQLGFLSQIGDELNIENAGAVDLDSEKSQITWKKAGSAPLNARFENTQIFANTLVFNAETQIVIAKGDVAVYKDGFVYRGQNIEYDINRDQLSANAIRSSLEPIYFDAGDFKTATKEISVLNMEDAYFTTHDSVDPNFRIKAKQVEIYPDDRIVFRNLTAYAGNLPVFYFPYLSQPFDGELGYTFAPGYSSSWGAYLLNQYGTLVGDHTIAKFHLDIRSTRGLAGGIDLISTRHRENDNFGEFKFYYANDSEPLTDSLGGSGATERLFNPPDSDRYRLNLQHRVYLPGPEESTFYVDLDINKLSDEFFYEDFFPAEFRVDPRPDNIINFVKRSDTGVLSLLTRFSANDFFQTDERLPEIAYDITRQPVFGNSGLFYESTTSFGLFTEDISSTQEQINRDRIDELEDQLALIDEIDENGDPTVASVLALDALNARQLDETPELELERLRLELDGASFTRFHTYHELLYPKVYGGWLSLTPRFGVGAQAYTSVEDRGDSNLSDDTRVLLHAGLDASFKLSKTYADVQNETFGVNGLRHIARPYVNISILDTDDQENNFRGVDRLVPSTRLRPLDVPRFTAVDDLNSWSIARVGFQNTLLTRRDNRNYAFAGLNTYVDVFFDDPEFDRSHSNLFNELFWRPLPWLRFTWDSQVPIGGGENADFTESIARVNFQPTDWWTFGVGHQLLQDHPFFEDSSLISFNTYARLSENWGVGMVHRYELDDGVLESQQYSIHRDLTSWTASFGAQIRDNRSSGQEFGLIFALTLKDFPQLSLPLSIDPSGGGE